MSLCVGHEGKHERKNACVLGKMLTSLQNISNKGKLPLLKQSLDKSYGHCAFSFTSCKNRSVQGLVFVFSPADANPS